MNKYLEGKRSVNSKSSQLAWDITKVSYCFKIGPLLKNNDLFGMKTIDNEKEFPECLDIFATKDLELAKLLFNEYIHQKKIYAYN